MSETRILISESLWLVVPDVTPEYDDGLITLCDDTGGNTLIDREEIDGLIDALKNVEEGEV